MIYFVRAGNGPIKIGYAQRPRNQVLTLQASHPEKLHLIAVCKGGYAEERLLHARWAAARLNGEWFTPIDDILAYIAAHGLPPETEPEGPAIRLAKSKTPWHSRHARAKIKQLEAELKHARKRKKKVTPSMKVLGLEFK